MTFHLFVPVAWGGGLPQLSIEGCFWEALDMMMARFCGISYRSPIFLSGAHDPAHFATILNLTFKMECHMTFHLFP